jgi:hypothetical protein
VAQGAILMGLGVNCDVPPPCVPCPFHIGVVVARPYRIYNHDNRQKYTDTFDSAERAKDNVNWIIRKGDLITQDTEAVTRLKLVRRIAAKEPKTGGTIFIVTSTNSDPRGPSPLRIDPSDGKILKQLPRGWMVHSS